MTCEPIDIIYFALGTGNFEFNVKKGHTEFGGTFGAVLHHLCNIPFPKIKIKYICKLK